MITPFQIATFFIYSIGIVLAIYFSTSIAENSTTAFVDILAVMGSIAWILFGSRIWWLPLFLGIGFGGVFWVGFKVYPQEVGLALALVTVVPALILQRFRLRPRQKLPQVFSILFAYLAIECLYSCIRFGDGAQGRGGIFRVYFFALWPFLFIAGFSFYSFSQHIRWGLYALQRGYLARISMDLASLAMPGFLYLPGINFILPASVGGLEDLRGPGLGLAIISLALLFSKRGIFLSRRTIIFPVIQVIRLLEALAALLFGGSRFSLIAGFLAIGFALIYSRRWIVITLFLILGGSVVGWINMYPQSLEKLPVLAERAASILILKDNTITIQEQLQGSNLWHQRLREVGFQRWTENPVSLFFGTGVHAFDPTIAQGAPSGDELFERALDNAANVGAFENGLFTVLSLTGLVGFALYAILFFQLIRRIFSLRAIADQDDFGRTLTFYAICQGVIWVISCYFAGSWPSFELMILGITAVYLQERADEQEASSPSRDVIPFHELTKS